MSPLIDRHNRVVDYLRVSLTDRCNLRCIYCKPPEGLVPFDQSEVLSDDEVLRVIRAATRLGVKRVRLTGGEPLTRKGLSSLIKAIGAIESIVDLGLTTNGTLLQRQAHSLAEAGLHRVNVSLDSLKPERFREIRRGAQLEDVLAGIAEASRVGLHPIKINMVPVKDLNDDEIEDFARLTLAAPYHVRFIELMPTGAGKFWTRDRGVPTAIIKKKIASIGPLTPLILPRSGPAEHYLLPGGVGVIGFISAISRCFCPSCNRLRLTCDGKVRPCLFSETEYDLRRALRAGASEEELADGLRLAVSLKPPAHNLLHRQSFDRLRPMSKIGG